MNFFWENTEKYKNISVQIEKEVIKVDKDGNEYIIIISYKIEFIESARFMASSLSNLVDNLEEGIHKLNVKLWLILQWRLFRQDWRRIKKAIQEHI